MTGTNRLFVVMLAAGMASLGCGDSGSGGSGTGAGGSGSGASGSGASGSGAAGPGSTGPGTGAGGVMECGPGGIDMNDPCEVCAATNCTEAALACCEQTNAAAAMGKMGCLDIIACVQETGCNSEAPMDPDGCLQPSPVGCNETIMDAGIAVALGEASALGDCVTMQCATECGIGGAGP